MADTHTPTATSRPATSRTAHPRGRPAAPTGRDPFRGGVPPDQTSNRRQPGCSRPSHRRRPSLDLPHRGRRSDRVGPNPRPGCRGAGRQLPARHLPRRGAARPRCGACPHRRGPGPNATPKLACTSRGARPRAWSSVDRSPPGSRARDRPVRGRDSRPRARGDHPRVPREAVGGRGGRRKRRDGGHSGGHGPCGRRDIRSARPRHARAPADPSPSRPRDGPPRDDHGRISRVGRRRQARTHFGRRPLAG
jgi:hypothetical protein